MNPEQIRARLAEISAKLEGFQAADMTDEQHTELDTLHAEFEGLEKKLVAAEKLETMKAKTSAGTGRKTAPTGTPAAPALPQVGASYNDRFGGFKSSGEFLMAVRDLGQSGKRDQRFNNVYYEKSAEDGGMLVPEEIRTDILKKLDSNESLLSRCNTTTVSGNSLTLPIDESQPWNSGVTAYWISEGAPYTESKGKLSAAHYRLHKLGAMVKATDELLEDSVGLASYIQNAAPEAIMQKVNEAIISGDGVGKPQGILNSPFAITVPKASGQAADTVVAQNLIDMYSRLLPGSRNRAVWIMNAGVTPAITGLQDGQGRYLFLGPGNQMNQGPEATILGLPVMPMLSSLPMIGDKGDIMLVDFNYYYAILKGGADQIRQAQSIHLHFDRDVTSFKFTMRLDGSCPFKAPVTTQYGAFGMSGIVTLADRA